MYDLLQKWITLAGEYPVENTHGVIRAQTRHSETATQLVNKVKSIIVSKTKQTNFHSHFTPPKHFSFSHGQLKYLKLKSSEFLTATLQEITKNQLCTTLHYPKKKDGKVKVTKAQFFGNNMKGNILPVSFLSETPSNENTKCDLPACQVDDDNEDRSVLTGCWHSFHNVCMENLTCPLCKKAINQKVEELGNIAKEAILFGNTADLNDADKNEDEETAIENCPNVPIVNDDQINECVGEMKARISNFSSNGSIRNPY